MAKSKRNIPPTDEELADALSDMIDLADSWATSGPKTYTLVERRRRDGAVKVMERFYRGLLVGVVSAVLVVATCNVSWARSGGGSGGHSGGGHGGGSLGAVHLSHTGNSAPYPPHLPYNEQGEPSGGHVFEKFFTKLFGG